MRATKICLSAVLLSSLSFGTLSAALLEEAIKDIEITGMARYRHYVDSDNPTFAGANPNDRQVNRFTGALDITSKINENLKFGTSLMVDTFNFAQNSPSSSGNIEVRQFYFQYFENNYNIKVGKTRLLTPWTNPAPAGTHGNGIVAQYTGFENLMLVGSYYNQVNAMVDFNKIIPEGGPTGYGQEDFFYAAAIANFNPVSVQLWANRMTNVIDAMVYLDINYKYDNFRLRGQVNYAKVADERKSMFADDDGIFYGFEAEYKSDKVFVNAGYTKTDEDMPIFAYNADNNNFIQFGEQLMFKGLNLADARLLFVRAGVIFDKLKLEAGYGYMDVGEKNRDMDEILLRASYKMSKNFLASTYYSILNSDKKGEDNNKLFIDLLYTF